MSDAHVATGRGHQTRETRKALAGRCALALLPVLAVLLGLSGCGGLSVSVSGGVIQVVAGENFWGSLAAQLGGVHVKVTSMVTDPSADPHQFETSAKSARTFAAANYVILNGAGYDSWGQKLVDANPVKGRKVFNVASLLGKKQGDNPHFWYDPDYVRRVIDQITADYRSLDPQDSAYFTEQREAFLSSLSQYDSLIASIKETYGGAKIGATESIFVYMADSLGLELITPPSFMNAVSAGNDPPTSAVAQMQQQITQKQIAVLVYNSQTETLVTTNIKKLASSNGIPMVGITETVVPPNVSFEDWQVTQLTALQQALGAGK